MGREYTEMFLPLKAVNIFNFLNFDLTCYLYPNF